MGIDGNETSREGSSHPLTGPELVVGMPTKVARGLMWDWTCRKHEEHWQSVCGQRHTKGFLEKPSAKEAAELLYLSRNQLRILTGLLTGHCHLIGHLIKLELVNISKCDRCK
jgi:hypothetical protein